MRVQLGSKAWINRTFYRQGDVIVVPDDFKPPKGSVILKDADPWEDEPVKAVEPNKRGPGRPPKV